MNKLIGINKKSKWDFRCDSEYAKSIIFEEKGYIIEKGSENHVGIIKEQMLDILRQYKNMNDISISLENVHKYLSNNSSNDLRLYMMGIINKDNSIHREYFKAANKLIYDLCGNELAMQKRIGMSLNLPGNSGDALPIHADTWNGVSPYELNIWIPLVDCKDSLCLYILSKGKLMIK